MARMIRQIDHKGARGFGHFEVEGVPGFFPEEAAKLLAINLGKLDEEKAATKAAAQAQPPAKPDK